MKNLPTFEVGEVLTAAKLNALVDCIKELQEVSGKGGNTSSGSDEQPRSVDPEAFIVRIDSSSGADHTATEQVPVSGGLEDFADSSRNCTSISDPSDYTELQGWENVPDDTISLAVETQEDDAFRYYFLHVPPPPPLQDGTKDYILGYDGATQQYKWYEQDDCDEA